MTTNKKLVVILGPTSSGKSDLAVMLAKEFNGEIISADSRQVYQGMDIGSGKITKKETRGIPHHLLDVASPKRRFTVTRYKNLAQKVIKKVYQKDKLPIICGGTGFYIQAVADGIVIPEVKPDLKLREQLEKKKTESLFAILEKIDPERVKNIDRNNRRRLIRAIEIIKKTKKPVPSLTAKKPDFSVLKIGIKVSKEELSDRIKKRLEKRLKQGMINEIKKLRNSGLSWKRLESFGLEYRFGSQFLQDKINRKQMQEKIQKESGYYAKRQMT
ncbi:MAG: tRNA (adenosine(37)-N6)-dimethylallyltransferase MiaA, partial [bacterium]